MRYSVALQEYDIYQRSMASVNELEGQFGALWTQCQRCQGSLHQVPFCLPRFAFMMPSCSACVTALKALRMLVPFAFEGCRGQHQQGAMLLGLLFCVG